MTAATQLAPDRRAELESVINSDYHRLLAWATKLSRPGVAEDNLQAAFVRALSFLSKFKGESSMRTWLMTIIRNTCFMEFRYSRYGDRSEWCGLEVVNNVQNPGYDDAILVEQLSKCLTVRMKRAVNNRLAGGSPENRSDILAMHHAIKRIRERHGIKV